jgi:hypothetical protein
MYVGLINSCIPKARPAGALSFNQVRSTVNCFGFDSECSSGPRRRDLQRREVDLLRQNLGDGVRRLTIPARGLMTPNQSAE